MRQRSTDPELEHEARRSPSLGFEPNGSFGVVRCLEHGFPTELTRWHYHPEYELHLITQTRGRAFVGDHIGHYEPGHLVLTGPRLPHNWVAVDAPADGPQRAIHKVLQFQDAPLRAAADQISELSGLLGLLDRSSYGIEFFGLSARAEQHFDAIKASHGLPRFIAFLAYLQDLVLCADYRLLSSVSLQSFNDSATAQTAGIVDYIVANFAEPLVMAEVAARFGMPEKYFSKYFRKATGNTFTDFVSRLRVNRACQLLASSDQYVANICYEVGFNNLANFNRRFMLQKGMTPRQFRQRSAERAGNRCNSRNTQANEYQFPLS